MRRPNQVALDHQVFVNEICLVSLIGHNAAHFRSGQEHDLRALVPEELVPVEPIGRMTLNRCPSNFFAEVEQVAFLPSNVVPGIDFSNDPLLAGRIPVARRVLPAAALIVLGLQHKACEIPEVIEDQPADLAGEGPLVRGKPQARFLKRTGPRRASGGLRSC